MGILDRVKTSFSAGHLAHAAYRFVQMVLALAVVGLYAQDLKAANKAGKYSDGKWVCLSPSGPYHQETSRRADEPLAHSMETHKGHMLIL